MRPVRFYLNVPMDNCYDHTMEIADADFARFAWVYDPEGNKVELWEPK